MCGFSPDGIWLRRSTAQSNDQTEVSSEPANEQAGNEQSFCVHFKRPDLGDCPNQIVFCPARLLSQIYFKFFFSKCFISCSSAFISWYSYISRNLTFSFFQNSENFVFILGALSCCFVLVCLTVQKINLAQSSSKKM